MENPLYEVKPHVMLGIMRGGAEVVHKFMSNSFRKLDCVCLHSGALGGFILVMRFNVRRTNRKIFGWYGLSPRLAANN